MDGYSSKDSLREHELEKEVQQLRDALDYLVASINFPESYTLMDAMAQAILVLTGESE